MCTVRKFKCHLLLGGVNIGPYKLKYTLRYLCQPYLLTSIVLV